MTMNGERLKEFAKFIIFFSDERSSLLKPIFCSLTSLPINKWSNGKTRPIDKISKKAVKRLKKKK